MMTYMEVHLFYTLPPTILLYLILRPFISSFDKMKILTLSALALIYTTPWDNYIIYCKAWWYRKDAVIGTIGYVPIEEYMFFIIQTTLTTLWTICCSRWTLNSLLLKQSICARLQSTRYCGVLIMLVGVLWGWYNAIPATKLFYLSSITWWTLLVAILLFYVTGTYVIQAYQQMLICILVPTVYLCYVDLIALRARVWHINEKTSLEIFIFDDLPLKEAIFFLLTNTIVVMGSAGFDKSKAVIDTYCRELFPCTSNTNFMIRYFRYVKSLAKGAVYNELNFDSTISDDLAICVDILQDASKTFSLAAKCFPNAIRQDITILYAFCRVTDDMVDNVLSMELKQHRLKIITEFLDQLFANRQITSTYCWKVKHDDPSIDWKYFEKQLSQREFCAFRAVSRISYYMPQEPFYELVRGFEWDIVGRAVLNENDLLEYSTYVASSVGTLCTFVYCHRSCQWPDDMGPICQILLKNARKMGQVLQICNISRDIITDSETLGRCYIPNDYLECDELKYLIGKNPYKIENSQLKKYAEKMLDIADNIASDALYCVNLLPSDCQRGVLSTLEAYRGIGKLIRSNAHYERRAVLSTIKKILIVSKCLYITSFPLS